MDLSLLCALTGFASVFLGIIAVAEFMSFLGNPLRSRSIKPTIGCLVLAAFFGVTSGRINPDTSSPHQPPPSCTAASSS
jgi:hypothetical protein